VSTPEQHSGWDCHVHVFDAAAASLPGHYRPTTRSLAEIEAIAAADGVGHLVLVQPSVYGSDNTLLLAALRASGGRHRGVAVLAADTTAAEFDTLHAAGVRGVRLNLMSPVGRLADPAAALQRLTPQLQRLGWHVQWYAPRSTLPMLVPLQAASGLVFVLDHLADQTADQTVDQTKDGPAWDALLALAGAGAWVKLSGWYRLQSAAPYDAMQPQIERVARLFGQRTVWGSDWPHTGHDEAAALPYASTWAPVVAVLGAEAAQAVRAEHPLRLYA
jgi:predicted TIM-barrel fold metal-dependent hydrolase